MSGLDWVGLVATGLANGAAAVGETGTPDAEAYAGAAQELAQAMDSGSVGEATDALGRVLGALGYRSLSVDVQMGGRPILEVAALHGEGGSVKVAGRRLGPERSVKSPLGAREKLKLMARVAAGARKPLTIRVRVDGKQRLVVARQGGRTTATAWGGDGVRAARVLVQQDAPPCGLEALLMGGAQKRTTRDTLRDGKPKK